MGTAAFIYRSLIDPMLNSSHRSATGFVSTGDRVLDVACGGGTMALMAGEKAATVIAIDTDTEMIDSARARAKEKGMGNVDFMEMDATDLSDFEDKEFDLSIISMAIHQFTLEEGLQVLKEIKRVSKRVVVVDYALPVRRGLYNSLTWLIESIAGGDHYRNFKAYMAIGGIYPILAAAGLKVREKHLRGRGTLVINHCD